MKNYRIIKNPDYNHTQYIVEKRMWPLFWEWDAIRPESGGPFRFITIEEAEKFIDDLKTVKPLKNKPLKYL